MAEVKLCVIPKLASRERSKGINMKVTIYTDGAARGNPEGPGGYGAVLQYIDPKGTMHEREFSAGYKKTTNNRMELMAAIVDRKRVV